MTVQRIALATIVLALLVAEAVAPTRYAQKRLARTGFSQGRDATILMSLPPIDKQALGSIDFIEYADGGAVHRNASTGVVPFRATVILIGWCGDPETLAVAGGAFLSIDGRKRIDVSQFLGGDRPDVARYYRSPRLERSGFQIRVPASAIGSGTHELQFGVIPADRRGYFTLGGPIDLTIGAQR